MIIDPAETAGAQVAGAGKNGLVRENISIQCIFFWMATASISYFDDANWQKYL